MYSCRFPNQAFPHARARVCVCVCMRVPAYATLCMSNVASCSSEYVLWYQGKNYRQCAAIRHSAVGNVLPFRRSCQIRNAMDCRMQPAGREEKTANDHLCQKSVDRYVIIDEPTQHHVVARQTTDMLISCPDCSPFQSEAKKE